MGRGSGKKQRSCLLPAVAKPSYAPMSGRQNIYCKVTQIYVRSTIAGCTK